MKARYIVKTGIFLGHEFIGEEINGRIIDCNSFGRSYPVENCQLCENIYVRPDSETLSQTDGLGNCFSEKNTVKFLK